MDEKEKAKTLRKLGIVKQTGPLPSERNLDRRTKEYQLKIANEKVRRAALQNYDIFSQRYIWIADKKGNLVKLKPNNAQKRLLEIIDKKLAEGKPVRIIILKARQEGISTIICGRFVFKGCTEENKNLLIVAHRDDSTAVLFRKAKLMNNKMDAEVKPLEKASNARELIYDVPSGYHGDQKGRNNIIRVQTAGTEGIGKSDTLHYAHLSEFAFWSGESPEKQLIGLMNAVPDEPGTEVYIESTANGFNDFKKLWDDAVTGQNAWTPIFLPWWEHDEYIIPFESDELKELFELQMGEYEKYLRDELKLPLERIHWWKNTLKSKCNNDMNMMKQENPSTPEEAFIMTGSPIFNNEKVQQRITYLRKHYEENPYKQGYFKYTESNEQITKFEFTTSNSKGWIKIYEDPKRGGLYVLGGDTKGEGHDWFSGQVIDNSTGKRVATLHMDISNSKPYTWQMYCLGKYYNYALIGIEMNFNTMPIEELERLNYDNQYVRERYDDMTHKIQMRHGWRTTGTTRPLIIDKEIETVENNIEVFTDIETLQEMLTFVRTESGKPDAIAGSHDDLLFADMIANEIRGQQRFGDSSSAHSFDISKLPRDYQEDYYNAEQQGNLPLLFANWRERGILDYLEKQ
jgi:hypothetical protein